MKIIFADLNEELVKTVREAVKELPIRTVRCYFGSVFSHKGNYVSASNPQFTFGGGIDAELLKRYPNECKQARKTRGDKRVGNIIFTVTVDGRYSSNVPLVRKALRFALKNTGEAETLVVSGLGTGIGGLDHNTFARLFVQAIKVCKFPQKSAQVPPKFESGKRWGVKVTPTVRWKFLREGMKSDYRYPSSVEWKLEEWKHISGKISTCNGDNRVGFHCSKTILQALGYVKGEILAQVEVKGNSDIDTDKEAYSDMRVVKAYKWQKKDSVALAIFSAELVLQNFEKEFPNDKRPREAIEAAKKWLKRPTAKNQSAAESAAWSAARSAAESARSAAESAAWSAAESAWSAAGSAAESAGSAAGSARSAAGSAAAREKLVAQINEWLENHVKELEEI